MNDHKILNLTFDFLAVALVSMSSPAVLTTAQPLQIIWDNTAHDGGTFSVGFSPDGQNLGQGLIVQSGAH